MCGRVEQVNNEIIPISRHLREAKQKRREEAFSVFVAPVVHPDTIEAKHKYNADILPFNINEFIEKINSSDHVSQLSGNFFIKLKI